MTALVYRESTAFAATPTFDELLAYAREFCCWGVTNEPKCVACQELDFIEHSIR